MTIILISCDPTWRDESAPGDLDEQLGRRLGGVPEGIPVTPHAALWTATGQQHQSRPNPLASALLGLLQLPLQQLQGPACLTGWRCGRPAGLTDIQRRGFHAALRTLLTMPDYLALHTQAGRVAAGWHQTSRRTP